MKNRRNQRRKKNNKIKIILIFLLIILILSLGVIIAFKEKDKKEQLELKNQVEKIKSHYGITVKTNEDSKIYLFNDGLYEEAGIIGKEVTFNLKEQDITYQTKYFAIDEFENEYYIKYEDVTPTDAKEETEKRYQKYIPFNENIITDEDVNFYDESDNLVYNIKESQNLPIIIKYGDSYGVEYNNQLLKVKKEDVKETKNNKNTDKTNTSGIAVLNYHFFYDESQESERKDCNQMICHSKSLYESHLKYITENNVFTPTMKEFEMYLDKKIQLPKSVLITIDDGWRMYVGIDLMEKYKVNGTVFLITSWFKEIKFMNDYKYVEFHSHGDNLHTGGECPGGQGGAIKCANKQRLLDDLALSKKKLGGTTYFCYPFYEYNNYSIEVLKEAGYTMSFAGGFRRAKPGDNKYALPRYVIYNNTTASDLKRYIG